MSRYSEKEIQEVSSALAQCDKAHEYVYWHCQHCGCNKRTAVDFKKTDMQCKCRRWMQWSYRPFTTVEEAA